MEEKYGSRISTHRLSIEGRENMEISGVLNVDSFDDEEVVMETEQGLLAVRGENLHINHLNLDQGDVKLTGLILELVYSEPKGYRAGNRGKSILERIFR